MTPERRRAWREGAVQLLVALVLLAIVSRVGAAYFGARLGGFDAEMQRRDTGAN